MNIFNNKKVCNVVSYVYDFARKSKKTNVYKRMYRNLARHLDNFSKERKVELMSDTFGDVILEDFIDYLKSINLMQSTVYNIVEKLKSAHKRIKRDGYVINNTFYDVHIKDEVGETVVLLTEEIRRIFELKLNKENRVIRDLFVVGCLTGMRYGDYSKINSDNIVGNTIVRKTLKTSETVIIPIHPIVRKILDANSGEFPCYRRSQQNFNMRMKNICKKAGITDEVLIERTIGYKVVRKRVKRYILIASHTARRSFATNAYLAGILPAQIMLLTGHKNEENFFRYIRINKMKNARDLADHEFFK